MTPEELNTALANKVRTARLNVEDGASSARRAAAELADTRSTIASASLAGLRPDHVKLLETLLEPDQAAVAAAESAKGAADHQYAAAQTAASQVGALHLELQAAGAAGAFYQGQPAAAAPPQPPSPTDPGAAAKPAFKDPLKVGTRIVLLDGEQFAGSASTKGSDGGLLLAAAVDTPDGRQIHVAVPVDDENRKNWRGGHAPERETAIDEEDGEAYTVDTYADVTAVIDAADAARLPEQVDEMVAKAAEVDKGYRRLAARSDRLYEERSKLEAKRFGDETAGEEKISADWKIGHEEYFQRRRRRHRDQAVDRLSPDDRARFDELQRQIDEAGVDEWEPGKEAEAAKVCGLTVDEFRELRELSRIPYRQRTEAQEHRHDELKYGGQTGVDSLNPEMPPLLAEQNAIVCGLTVDEYREMEALERIPKRNRLEGYNRGRRVRTPQEQTRLDELDNRRGGAEGATPRKTYKLRARFLSSQRTHHSSKFGLVEAREAVAAMDATARPLEPGEAAELARITAEKDAIDKELEKIGGYTSASAEIPARNGGALIVEATQQEEEGGVKYTVVRRPADADEDWQFDGDPYATDAAGIKSVAKKVAALAGQAA